MKQSRSPCDHGRRRRPDRCKTANLKRIFLSLGLRPETKPSLRNHLGRQPLPMSPKHRTIGVAVPGREHQRVADHRDNRAIVGHNFIRRRHCRRVNRVGKLPLFTMVNVAVFAVPTGTVANQTLLASRDVRQPVFCTACHIPAYCRDGYARGGTV